jgi:hypothetical protein
LWGAALYISALSHGLNCSKSDIVSHAWNFCWCAAIKLMIDKILNGLKSHLNCIKVI